MASKKKNLKTDIQKKICIVGIGNPLRSDDGLGAYVCEQIEDINLPVVSVITKHQLDTGMTEELSKFKKVIFIDASVKNETISLKRLPLKDNYPESSSHQVNPNTLVKLAKKLYPTKTQFYMCTIGGNNFEMGNRISEQSLNYAHEAVSLLVEWIKSNA